MRNYNVPFNKRYEDKILGGKLTLRQGLWFTPPVLLTLLLFQNSSLISDNINGQLVLSPVKITIFILLDLSLILLACIFSFIKVNGFSLDSYMYKKIKFKNRVKKIKYYK